MSGGDKPFVESVVLIPTTKTNPELAKKVADQTGKILDDLKLQRKYKGAMAELLAIVEAARASLGLMCKYGKDPDCKMCAVARAVNALDAKLGKEG